MRKLAWALVMLCALRLAAAELLSARTLSPDKALAALFGEAPSVEASVMLNPASQARRRRLRGRAA